MYPGVDLSADTLHAAVDEVEAAEDKHAFVLSSGNPECPLCMKCPVQFDKLSNGTARSQFQCVGPRHQTFKVLYWRQHEDILF